MMNYISTFIAVADDYKAEFGKVPVSNKAFPTVPVVHYQMLIENPYRYTQEDVLFASCAEMRENPDISAKDQAKKREEFFSRSQACLRASSLGKTYGWGIHFDADGKGAAYGVETDEYQKFLNDKSLTQTKAMRSKR